MLSTISIIILLLRHVVVFSRNCIGQHFAMDEMKTCVALLVKNFEFEVDESVKVEMRKRLSMQSKEGIWLKMKKVSTYSDNLRRESGSN